MSDFARRIFADSILAPFDASKNRARDIGFGEPSTERVITEQAPDGRFWNIPTVWWTRNGDPVLLGFDAAMQQAREYEAATGMQFPRFDSVGQGVFRAMNRSAKGGAEQSPLAALPWGVQ